jgi:predicted Zn finger-like uncharacterized protein
MNFFCPRCQTVHGVAPSMIPAGGLPLVCRRCGTSFVAAPPADAARGEDPEEREGSTLGRSFEEETMALPQRSGPAPVAGTPGTAGGARARPRAQEVTATGAVFLDPAPGAEESTRRLELDEQGAPLEDGEGRILEVRDGAGWRSEPAGRGRARKDDRSEGATRSELDRDAAEAPSLDASRSGSDPSGDLYERLERGTFGVGRKARRGPTAQAAPKPVEGPSGPVGVLERFALALNRAPLALRAVLLVAPVTLGLLLLATALFQDAPRPVEGSEGADPSPPLELVPPAPRARPATSTVSAVTSTLAVPSSTGAVVGLDALDDRAAPDGFAYVQTAGALRGATAEDATAVAELEAGALVRRYDRLGDWALIAVPDGGPAGYVPAERLGAMKPLSRLAEDRAFTGCVVPRGKTLDDCLVQAKAEEERCLGGCGAVERAADPRVARCVEACGLAFARCGQACRESLPGAPRRAPPR